MTAAAHQIDVAGRIRHRHGWRPPLPGGGALKLGDSAIVPRGPVASRDLRELAPPTLDQGAEGSCTAHAMRYGLAVLRALLGRDAHADSRRMLYWLARAEAGFSTVEDTGATIAAVTAAAQRDGACDELVDPYPADPATAAAVFATPPTPTSFTAARPHRLGMAFACSSVDGAINAITHGLPVLCGVSLFGGIQSQDTATTGRVPMPSFAEAPIGGHAQCLLWVDQARGEVWALNSWGDQWGATSPTGQRGFAIYPVAYLRQYGAEFTTLTSLAPAS